MSLDRIAGRRSGNVSRRRGSFLPQEQRAGLALATADPSDLSGGEDPVRLFARRAEKLGRAVIVLGPDQP
jgi:hypothetical protein